MGSNVGVRQVKKWAQVREKLEVSFDKLEKPSLNRGGGLRHQLLATYNAVLWALPQKVSAVHTHHKMNGRSSPMINQIRTNDH